MSSPSMINDYRLNELPYEKLNIPSSEGSMGGQNIVKIDTNDVNVNSKKCCRGVAREVAGCLFWVFLLTLTVEEVYQGHHWIDSRIFFPLTTSTSVIGLGIAGRPLTDKKISLIAVAMVINLITSITGGALLEDAGGPNSPSMWQVLTGQNLIILGLAMSSLLIVTRNCKSQRTKDVGLTTSCVKSWLHCRSSEENVQLLPQSDMDQVD